MKKQIDKNRYKKLRMVVFWGIMVCILFSGIRRIYRSIPNTLYIDENEADALRLIDRTPWITTEDAVAAATGDSYTISCKLWNIIPLKTVTVSRAEAGEVAVSGKHTGIYLEMDGILVIGTEKIIAASGEEIAPAEGILEKGDYIKSIDGQALEGKNELVFYMKASGGEPVSITFIRKGQEQNAEITPVCGADESYKLGIWVRDNAQGIGTLTYITSEGAYGALGHGVSDGDTGENIGIRSGDLYASEIIAIEKGRFGKPGELQGVIKYGDSTHLGSITANTSCGIFGKIDKNRFDNLASDWYPVAFKQELHQGDAAIICTLDEETREYDAEIEEIYWCPSEVNKCFSIHVTDEELLEATGGIVQGLSGSPIIQDGKLVGAVTHVLVNDPTRGYGIFIENMLDAAG